MSCGHLETDGGKERVEIVDDALVERVELMAFLLMELGISGEGLEEPGRQRRVDALEEFEEHETDRVSVGEESISAAVGHLLNKALGAKLGEVVSKGRDSVRLGCAAEGGNGVRMKLAGRERPVSGQVRHARAHDIFVKAHI